MMFNGDKNCNGCNLRAATTADLHALETRLIKWIVGAFLGGMVAAAATASAVATLLN